MIVIVFAMLVIVAAAVVLVAVMAYPNQGREVPHAPAVNMSLHKVAEMLGLGHDRREAEFAATSTSRDAERADSRG